MLKYRLHNMCMTYAECKLSRAVCCLGRWNMWVLWRKHMLLNVTRRLLQIDVVCSDCDVTIVAPCLSQICFRCRSALTGAMISIYCCLEYPKRTCSLGKKLLAYPTRFWLHIKWRARQHSGGLAAKGFCQTSRKLILWRTWSKYISDIKVKIKTD